MYRTPGVNEQVKTGIKSWKATDEINLGVTDVRSQLRSLDQNPGAVKPSQPGAEPRRRELRRKKSEDRKDMRKENKERSSS